MYVFRQLSTEDTTSPNQWCKDTAPLVDDSRLGTACLRRWTLPKQVKLGACAC